MANKKVLIAGSTGYIGGLLTKKMAALNPTWSIKAMTRKNIDLAKIEHQDIARHTNVDFVKSDCLKVETYPNLKEFGAIVHSVGSITDLINYK